MEQIQKLLAKSDVHWANWLNSRDRESTGKEPEIADELPSVSTVATSEFYVPQPSAAFPVNQPQYGVPMNYFSGQTETPIYTDPISSANISRTNELVPYMPPAPPGTQCHLSVLSPTRCLTDTCNVGTIDRDRLDRLISPVRPVSPNRSDRSHRTGRPNSLFQTSAQCLHPRS